MYPRAFLTIALLLIGLGCGSSPVPSLASEDAGERIPAIREAGRRRDARAVPQLVAALKSDDPAVRFYAIQALERITGTTRGYRYFDGEDQRAAAVTSWESYVKHHDRPTSSASTRP